MSDARRRTLELYADLTPEQRLGPRLAVVNPPQWELGHVGWFQERWVLRTARGLPPIASGDDALYDSSLVAHDDRWSLPLREWDATRAHLADLANRVVDGLAGQLAADEEYFVRLAVFHEDMHGEAFLYTRQTLGYGLPPVPGLGPVPAGGGPLPGDARVPGGRFAQGARPGADPFVFDNEKWAHEVEVAPFSIARAATTEAQMAAFVDDGGYDRQELWSAEGWRWRAQAGARHPLHWRRADTWQVRELGGWRPLAPHRAVVHVAWFEAEAYCRWAGRRLPTELEWEVAAAGEPDGRALASGVKRRFPWGDDAPTPQRANLDLRASGPVEVGALPDGDSAFGCRQMIGNVWEWTSTDFAPYPGFVVDPYAEYSAPWFGDHKVLRGGCYATRARLLRNTWRNFYRPDRRDVLAGFRTCAPG